MVSFKDKTVERVIGVLLAVAVIAFIIFLVVQARGEDKAAAEFFDQLRKK
jgi:succinate dehydrogenase hydrophobic anchor subunit